MCAERASIRLAETLSSDESAQEEFIYVYDMPAEFTDDLSQLPLQWHPSQDDYDQVCYFLIACISFSAHSFASLTDSFTRSSPI